MMSTLDKIYKYALKFIKITSSFFFYLLLFGINNIHRSKNHYYISLLLYILYIIYR